MNTFAFDFETYYDKDRSAAPLGVESYFNSLSLEEIYMVSVAGDNGFEFVGRPQDLDWSFFEGCRALAHNAGFDLKGVRRLRDLGLKIPEPAEVHDTADLSAYCGYPRALKGAAHAVFGVSVDKGIRDKDMKGKQWHDMTPELRQAVSDYALEDSRLTLRLWKELSPKWPEKERMISKLSRDWAAQGIATDVDEMDKAITRLKQTVFDAERNLPWVLDGKPPLSPKALGIACRDAGILPPASMAIDSEDCDVWLDQYGDKFPWVSAMRDWRRCNAIIKKLESMKIRTHGGRLRYDIKYWGAGMTGRWSGAGGVNVQNLSGKNLYGVNMRDMLVAAPGHTLIAADLAQIEPRVACWLAKETEALEQMAAGISPYIVYARQAMGLGANEEWAKSDPRYKIAKMSVLGASYCAGHHRFMELLRSSGMEDVLEGGPEHDTTPEAYVEYIEGVGRPEWIKKYREATEQERRWLMRSWEIIMTFRNGRPQLVGLWKQLGEAAKKSAERGEDLVLNLPAGRSLTYKHCRSRRIPTVEGGGQEVVAEIVRGGKVETTRIHQGILIENLCQSIARDAFRDCLLGVTEAGWKVIFHVHDELIVEVPESRAEQAKNEILAVMARSPKWAPTLPVQAEATIADRYSKAK
jgi:DNA polymerase I-like protein with 3'-5' exonuclease and polymerase domains